MERVKYRCNQFSLPIQAFLSVVVYYGMEAVSRHSMENAFLFMTQKPLVFAYNAAILFVTSLPVYLVRRRIFYRTLWLIFWNALGIINGVLLTMRVTPFTGPDVKLAGDALKLITVYLTVPAIIGIAAGIILAVVVLAFFFFKAPKFNGKLIYYRNIPFVLVMFAAFWGITQLALEKRVLSRYFGNIAFAYEDYGYPYCLATTLFNTGIQMPEKYSETMIQNLTTEPEVETEEFPNIIFVQLESFFDPTLVEFLSLSEDPIPYFRALSEEYSSGYFRVPSVGAGTANTEFETITGMNLRYFGPGEYPYKTILKKSTCESMAYVLKEWDYTAHAIHNNDADFYGRDVVFSNLGFDTFTSIEYMQNEEYTAAGWAKDFCLTEQIMNCLETTPEQDFVYAISVQGHGEYPTHQVLEDPLITVELSRDSSQKYAWEYYVNQLYEMDLFLEELIRALTEWEEDTVLVLYGDHLPTMGLEVQDLENRYLFQTEYVIWDNMGLPKHDQNLSSYQMGAEVMDQLGIHSGTLFSYHQQRKNSKNYQLDLQELQYDILYGEQYAYSEGKAFEPADLTMGVKDIYIRTAYYEDEILYVFGNNFTRYSQIEIDGKLYETEYLGKGLLSTTVEKTEEWPIIRVAQLSASSNQNVFSSTREYQMTGWNR